MEKLFGLNNVFLYLPKKGQLALVFFNVGSDVEFYRQFLSVKKKQMEYVIISNNYDYVKCFV